MAGRSRADPDQDTMLRFAVVRAIEDMGEAASRVSRETRATCDDLPGPLRTGP